MTEVDQRVGDRLDERRRPADEHVRALVGRIDPALLEAACFPPDERAHVFVCGPTPFVETVADTLVDLGHDPERIRTERFGPTGK